MKWRVDIEYEDGSLTEPRRIAFQAVYDGEPYHGYDTKREALEAFCYGQIAIDKLRKEAEKEQHKINPCEPQTNREDMDFDTGQAYTWEQKEEPKLYEVNPDDLCHMKAFVGKPSPFAKTLPICFSRLDNMEAHIAKIEERLTEIDGVLSSIGSPDYDLRKKVEGLEKGLAQLTDTFYICANNETHNYDDLRKRVGELEKDLYKISHLLGKDDSTDELKISKLDVASQKIDLLLAFLEAVCRNLGNDIKKIK